MCSSGSSSLIFNCKRTSCTLARGGGSACLCATLTTNQLSDLQDGAAVGASWRREVECVMDECASRLPRTNRAPVCVSAGEGCSEPRISDAHRPVRWIRHGVPGAEGVPVCAAAACCHRSVSNTSSFRLGGRGGGSCGSPVSELLCQHYIILTFQPIRTAEEVRF